MDVRTPKHYQLAIQPVEYITRNGLGFCEGNVVKYVSRYKQKDGMKDLIKARHYLDMLIDGYGRAEKDACAEVKVKLDGGIMPAKGSSFAAAYDLYVPHDVTLSHGRQVIDLGFCIELPHCKAAIIQPRSGFASKGIEVMMSADGETPQPFRLDADVIIGLVDEDYRGHTGVILDVHYEGSETLILQKGTRIAQMRIVDVPETELVEAEELDMSNDRGGGFGHTGEK